MKRKLLTGISAALGMLLLILDAKTALAGAAEGIELCIRTIVPSMLPFFLLSVLLTGSLAGVNARFLSPLGKLCAMPTGSEALLITGLLGGYPVGAQVVTQAWRSGQLNYNDAQRLLGFCSNAGPAFLFGIIAAQFPQQHFAWALWLIHILSALLVGIFLPGRSSAHAVLKPQESISISAALERSLKITSSVCGWVILFRITIAFLDLWLLWLLPCEVRVLLCGLLELANGCCQLVQIHDLSMRFIVCSVMLSLGGICVTMQTVSATDGLGLGQYLPGKLLQGSFSLLLSFMATQIASGNSHRSMVFWLLCMLLLMLPVVFFHRKKKYVAFQR